MTETELTRLLELCDGATQGKLYIKHVFEGSRWVGWRVMSHGSDVGMIEREADADYIAATGPSVVRALIARVRELGSEVAKWQEAASALDGRLGFPNDASKVGVALGEYVKSEDALPDTFHSETYTLSGCVEALVCMKREVSDG